jgi:predicted dehydrogenase
VDICLPTYLHATYAIEALEAGHHVLCEKPMALTLEDADRMIDASERAGRRLMIAQCIRFWPEYMYLRQAVREGTYGKLLSLNMYRIGGRPVRSWENWFLDPARSGGPIRDLHIHDVDYVHSLLGIPDRVGAVGRRSEATGSYDIVHAAYGYDDGPQVHLHAGWSMAQIPFQAGYDAWFERGFLRYDGRSDPPLTLFDDLIQVNGRPVEYERGNAYYNEIAYFMDCVATGTHPAECPPRSARGSLALIEREIASIENGEIVKGV